MPCTAILARWTIEHGSAWESLCRRRRQRASAMKGQGSHLISAFVLWVALTVIGEFLAFADIYPTVGSHEAQDFNDIFQYLLIVGVPVYTFVLAVLFYSFLRFRAGGPKDDAPNIQGTGLVPRAWLVVTSALAVSVIIHPGLTGLATLRGTDAEYGFGEAVEESALIVNVTGFRWAWVVDYEESGVSQLSSSGELVLPVDHQVVFRVSSTDVVHSFWIPAFRMKIDAIPGRTTELSLTPTRLGDFADDAAYRVQCAELCGLDHAVMAIPVRVVEQAEFDEWLASQAE